MKSRKETDFSVFRDKIRQAGLRSTQARVAVLERLQSAAGPLTHAQVADDLEARGFDKATIYRSLVELAEVGLLSRMELGDHVWRYELRAEKPADEHAPGAEHLHFVCTDCGKIECLDGVTVDSALAPAIKRATGGTINDVLLKGTCRKCE